MKISASGIAGIPHRGNLPLHTNSTSSSRLKLKSKSKCSPQFASEGIKVCSLSIVLPHWPALHPAMLSLLLISPE